MAIDISTQYLRRALIGERSDVDERSALADDSPP